MSQKKEPTTEALKDVSQRLIVQARAISRHACENAIQVFGLSGGQQIAAFMSGAISGLCNMIGRLDPSVDLIKLGHELTAVAGEVASGGALREADILSALKTETKNLSGTGAKAHSVDIDFSKLAGGSYGGKNPGKGNLPN